MARSTMGLGEPARDLPRRTQQKHRGKKPRARLTVAGVLGDLLITAGLIVVGYIVWQPWYTSTVVTAAQTELSSGISQAWREAAEEQPSSTTDGEIPVDLAPPSGEALGILYVPAFGDTYANVIGEGTDLETVLNVDEKGIGRYSFTQMPGEPGNFAIAGHRSGPLINSFREVMNLRIGDPIFVETPSGWYTYRYRSTEYVLPTQIDVVSQFPRADTLTVTDRILTMTTCHPKWAGSAERAIAYAVMEDFQPLSEGPPEELKQLNPNMQEA